MLVVSCGGVTPADCKEAFNLICTDGHTRPGNVWPELPGFRHALQRYFDALLNVGRTLRQAFALDLGLAEDFFADKIDRPMATLRLLRYPGPALAVDRTTVVDPSAAPAQTSAATAAPLGAGTHTDYGNVTLLATDGVAGLQVRRRNGSWQDVPALPGAFVCNIGDCLMRWTNDVYVSTPHRVQAPASERYSIALFLDPNPDAEVSAIASCVAPGLASPYPPIRAEDYLGQRFAATYQAKVKG